MREAGGDVIGLDWRIDLDRGWDQLGPDVGVQGNLDPLALFAPKEALLDRVDLILRQAAGRRGHVFNLGHGILPGTPVENVRLLVERVHQRPPP
jgi:uroporphyrinogen decarboxylase